MADPATALLEAGLELARLAGQAALRHFRREIAVEQKGDGTRTFVRGVALWGSLVAIVEHDTVRAGAAVYPAVGEELAAAPGQGSWHNGNRSRVSEVGELSDATVLTTDEHGVRDPAAQRGWQRLAEQARTARTWGDCGTMTDLRGASGWNLPDAIATNAAIGAAARQCFAG